MSGRTAARIARASAGFSAAMGIGGLVANQVVGLELTGWKSIFLVAWVLTFALLGALIVSRQPGNVFGWIFTLTAVLITFNLAGGAYANFAVIKQRGAGPAGPAIAWLAGGWNWIPITAILLIFIPLLFPSGRLLSARWRWVVWCGVAFVLLAAIPNALLPGPLFDTPRIRNPVGIEGSANLLDLIRTLSLIPAVAGVAGALATLALRLRRAKGQEHQQLKWFVYGCVLFMIPLLVKGPVPVQIQDILTVVLWPALPISLGIAMLKYRLYDIDPVINKSLVFGALAVFITAVYVGVVVGIGALIGGTGRPNLALSIVATAIVATAFQPVRERVQRIANALVYGQRATPYEVIANFAERMAGAMSLDQALPELAEAAAGGVAAKAVRIRLFLPDGSERSVFWPAIDQAEPFDRILPVSYRGARVGEVAVRKAVNEPFTPTDNKLLGDLATQAGVVLHNVRLTVELEAGLAQISSQAEQLRTSRDRIVRARDEERRRLEETIRRSSEQQLSQIRSELATTVRELTMEPDTAVRSLQRMTEATTAVLEELRELARGIYPPVLESQGLAAALKSHVSRLGAVVEVESDGIDRYPSEIEAAIYFCCVEALRGVSGPAAVGLRGRGAGVDFSITGCGPLDRRLLRIEDRVEALGGTVQFDGSRLVGSIPIDQFFFAASQAAVSRSGSNLALEM
jgi:signal transduction histidine kinase